MFTEVKCEAGLDGNEVLDVEVIEEQLPSFEDEKTYLVLPSAMDGVVGLSLVERKDITIIFAGGQRIRGDSEFTEQYAGRPGILNIVDCENITIIGLNVESMTSYVSGSLAGEMTPVVFVNRSSGIFLDGCEIRGLGKGIICSFGGSDVTVQRTRVYGGYFLGFAAGSNLAFMNNCYLEQDLGFADSHSLFLTVSAYEYNGGRYFGAELLFDKTCSALIKQGRSVVTGNGNWNVSDILSEVLIGDFSRIVHDDPLFGVVAVHENFNSINVVVGENLPTENYLSTPATGEAKFINYYPSATFPPTEHPLVVGDFDSSITSNEIQ